MMTLAESWRLFGDLLEKRAEEMHNSSSQVSQLSAISLMAVASVAEEVAQKCHHENAIVGDLAHAPRPPWEDRNRKRR